MLRKTLRVLAVRQVQKVVAGRKWTAYGVFLEQSRNRKEVAGLGGPVRARLLAALWKECTPEQKAEFTEVASQRLPIVYVRKVGGHRPKSAYNKFIGAFLAGDESKHLPPKERFRKAVQLYRTSTQGPTSL